MSGWVRVTVKASSSNSQRELPGDSPELESLSHRVDFSVEKCAGLHLTEAKTKTTLNTTNHNPLSRQGTFLSATSLNGPVFVCCVSLI